MVMVPSWWAAYVQAQMTSSFSCLSVIYVKVSMGLCECPDRMLTSERTVHVIALMISLCLHVHEATVPADWMSNTNNSLFIITH